jgi:pSer/pThr/pTyr-binding forkhead associated (FHA) protein
VNIEEIAIDSPEVGESLSEIPAGTAWILNRVNQEFDGPDRVMIATETLTVGRSEEYSLPLPSASVSRKHGRIDPRDGKLFVTDLGSTNGTFVNGQIVTEERELHHGDIVHFGCCSYSVTHVEPKADAEDDPRKSALATKFQALKERRDDPRCEIVDSDAIELQVRSASAEHESVGRLANLSRDGITLVVSTELQFGDMLTVHFCCHGELYEESLTAKVMWVRPVGEGRWDVGCRIDDGDIITIYDRLGAARVVDRRRRHERITVDIDANVYFELDENAYPVQVRNYSLGGFCMLTTSDKDRAVGSKIRLVLDAEHTVFGQVRWTKPCDEGHLVGCEFFGPSKTKGSQVIKEVSG